MPLPDKKLQALWDKKLKKSGFDDIESKGAYGSYLKRFHKADIIDKFKNHDGAIKMEYFAAAGRFLYDYKWESLLDRTIWELHCQGLSIREIVKALKGTKVRSKWKVHQTIQRLKTAMVDKWRE